MKVWITKYALSRGIWSSGAEACSAEGMIRLHDDPARPFANPYFHGRGRDWHTTEADARAKAEAMRKARIASLQRQITALEKLRF